MFKSGFSPFSMLLPFLLAFTLITLSSCDAINDIDNFDVTIKSTATTSKYTGPLPRIRDCSESANDPAMPITKKSSIVMVRRLSVRHVSASSGPPRSSMTSSVAASMPRSLCCTGLGGLAV